MNCCIYQIKILVLLIVLNLSLGWSPVKTFYILWCLAICYRDLSCVLMWLISHVDMCCMYWTLYRIISKCKGILYSSSWQPSLCSYKIYLKGIGIYGIWLRAGKELDIHLKVSCKNVFKTSRLNPQLEINILPSIWQFFLPDAKLDLVENETLKRTQLILLVLLAS